MVSTDTNHRLSMSEFSCLGEDEPHDLRHELEMLQQSTRNVLHESWGEIESLHTENASMKGNAKALEEALRDSCDREEVLKRQVQELQDKLARQQQQQGEGRLGMIRRSLSFKNRLSFSTLETDGSDQEDLHASLRSIESAPLDLANLLLEGVPSPGTPPPPSSSSPPKLNQKWNLLIGGRSNSYQQQRQQQQQQQMLQQELLNRLEEIEKEKQAIIAESQSMLQTRDSIVQSMEQATRVHMENVEEIKKELAATRDKAAAREKKMLLAMEKLKKKVVEKKRIIQEQRSKLEGYQYHIEDLETALRRSSLVGR